MNVDYGVLWPLKKDVWYCYMRVTTGLRGFINHKQVKLTSYPRKFRGYKRHKGLKALIEKAIHDPVH